MMTNSRLLARKTKMIDYDENDNANDDDNDSDEVAMMVIMMAHHLSSGLPTKISSLPSFVFTVLLCHLSSNWLNDVKSTWNSEKKN